MILGYLVQVLKLQESIRMNKNLGSIIGQRNGGLRSIMAHFAPPNGSRAKFSHYLLM